MLEKYDQDPDTVLKKIMKDQNVTKTEALAILRKKVPKEAYFQKKVIDGIKERYRYKNVFVVKVAQGFYSERGMPDVMAVIDGHYFGFEVKRPMFGKASASQLSMIDRIRRAGGTAGVVSYPDEAFNVIDDYLYGGSGDG